MRRILDGIMENRDTSMLIELLGMHGNDPVDALCRFRAFKFIAWGISEELSKSILGFTRILLHTSQRVRFLSKPPQGTKPWYKNQGIVE